MVRTFTAACFCGFLLCSVFQRCWERLAVVRVFATSHTCSLPTSSMVSSLLAARLLSPAVVGTWSTLTCPVFSRSRLLYVFALSLTLLFFLYFISVCDEWAPQSNATQTPALSEFPRAHKVHNRKSPPPSPGYCSSCSINDPFIRSLSGVNF